MTMMMINIGFVCSRWHFFSPLLLSRTLHKVIIHVTELKPINVVHALRIHIYLEYVWILGWWHVFNALKFKRHMGDSLYCIYIFILADDRRHKLRMFISYITDELLPIGVHFYELKSHFLVSVYAVDKRVSLKLKTQLKSQLSR